MDLFYSVGVFSMNMLFWSQVISFIFLLLAQLNAVYQSFKYTSCCCDPKVIETARSGIIFSTLVSLGSTIALLSMIFYKGWDFHTLDVWKMISSYVGIGALVVSIISYSLMYVRDFFLGLFLVSFLLIFLSFDFFLFLFSFF